MNNHTMKSASNVVKELKVDVLSKRLGVGSSAICNAAKAGRFPAAWFHEMEQLALVANIELPRHLFNWRRGNGRRKAMGP
ncbi:hypothetical protein [Pseudovibrio sp. Alg231-02]|uniref:hypothetical protein n=1 Tax=Pseudovibrio sp. Alg231-02 TaxID=1922223 RepID=UPI00131EE9E9|nr:hypothetical protein [Pseudovibrio sp. Alg231-02]